MSAARPAAALAALCALAAFAGFAALGTWQLHRLRWKEDLIARVEARVNARPVAPPGPESWAGVTREGDEYRHVRLRGRYLQGVDIAIYTPSDLGPSDWILTPLRTGDGAIVMVNRGLVPERLAADPPPPPEGETSVTGLLRISESEGWLFSRENRPQEGRWFRRDIGSIVKAKGYAPAAPYFVDAEQGAPGEWPRGGMTVVKFRNAHLGYAVTWFALAALSLAAGALFLRQGFAAKAPVSPSRRASGARSRGIPARPGQ